MSDEKAMGADSEAVLLGACMHEHCPLDGPHWHGGIYRTRHIRELRPTPTKRGDA